MMFCVPTASACQPATSCVVCALLDVLCALSNPPCSQPPLRYNYRVTYQGNTVSYNSSAPYPDADR